MDEQLYKEVLSTKPNKKKVSYSLESDIVETFNKVARAKNYNKSQIVENLLKSFLEREQKLI